MLSQSLYLRSSLKSWELFLKTFLIITFHNFHKKNFSLNEKVLDMTYLLLISSNQQIHIRHTTSVWKHLI